MDLDTSSLLFVLVVGYLVYYTGRQVINSWWPLVETIAHDGGKCNSVVVQIQWCGGCGFEDRYQAAKRLIVDKFPSGVTILSKMDRQVTGNFEITVNGYLAHSLKTKRHGFMHNNPERQLAVFDAIEVALEELEEDHTKKE
mmetsp:Transcript_36065/g.57768  ORF Transcript_36065/g.57768 Transcript_36065/m.57768 type:complete len:141 (+) Transcript_36065:1497-1919(+)